MDTPHTILIIEDEFIIADQIKAFLQNEGYNKCSIADTYTEAIHKINLLKPDLVIADIRLYDDYEGGIRVGKYIGEHFYIPIVYLSGYSDKKTIEKAKLTNPNTFLIKPKPLDKEQLLATIQMALPNNLITANKSKYLHLKCKSFNPKNENQHHVSELELITQKIDITTIAIIETFNHISKNTLVLRSENNGICYVVRDEMEKFISLLPNHFVRVHKSYVVSRNHINGYKLPDFILCGESKIPIGDKFKNDVLSML